MISDPCIPCGSTLQIDGSIIYMDHPAEDSATSDSIVKVEIIDEQSLMPNVFCCKLCETFGRLKVGQTITIIIDVTMDQSLDDAFKEADVTYTDMFT